MVNTTTTAPRRGAKTVDRRDEIVSFHRLRGLDFALDHIAAGIGFARHYPTMPGPRIPRCPPPVDMPQSPQNRNLLKTLPLQIADALAEQIAEGRPTPGERLRENDLATAYGVSRATVREALRLLEIRGLVTIQPQRGARVTQLSAKEILDLYAMRAAMVSAASRLAAERCTPAEARALKQRLQQLEENVDDAAEYLRHSRDLVEYIATLADNPILANHARDIAKQIGIYVRISLSTLERRQRSLVTWEETIDAITGRDPERAAACHYRLAIQNRDAVLEELARTGTN
ncbi:GntR family transcriptional regulator [Bordetella petrii]|uniref:GntR family transcriptional regulator n=1 Tax=Bordetella petrii TaxID=94624 RepID=UPI001E59021C|nr:GntR family transcriptional regulator [Bordetella petrii]MCD0502721.1 GntR family transcriptional regulator [Bordetella petrii]